MRLKLLDLILDLYNYIWERYFNNEWDAAEEEKEWDEGFTSNTRTDWRYFYND